MSKCHIVGNHMSWLNKWKKPAYEEGSSRMSDSVQQNLSRLGSSKSCISDQQEQGKELIPDMMMEAPEGTTFAFTDGSCLTNPGPCGAGAVIYQEHHHPVCLKRSVCRRGTIYTVRGTGCNT